MENDQNKMTELLENESFLGWYFKSDPSDVGKWENTLLTNPEMKEEMDKAVQFLNALQIKEPSMLADTLAKAEKRLLSAINKPIPKARVTRMVSSQAWKWAAASILFIVCISIFLRITAKHSVDTIFAQIKEQELPDGSQVVLNAHSRITYSRQWSNSSNKDREVWIKGEAYFHVKKTAAKTRFVVHTTEFDIVVTGTQFNVNQRDEHHPRVVLREGSITIKRSGFEDVFLKPGESFEILDNDSSIKKATNPEVPMAWIDKKLSFDNTPMSEVKKSLEDIYGAEVVFTDASIATENITGIMPNDNLDVFIESLQATMEYNVVRKGKVITISKNH